MTFHAIDDYDAILIRAMLQLSASAIAVAPLRHLRVANVACLALHAALM